MKLAISNLNYWIQCIKSLPQIILNTLAELYLFA